MAMSNKIKGRAVVQGDPYMQPKKIKPMNPGGRYPGGRYPDREVTDGGGFGAMVVLVVVMLLILVAAILFYSRSGAGA